MERERDTFGWVFERLSIIGVAPAYFVYDRRRVAMEIINGVCRYSPRGECSLVEAVELLSTAIGYCRRHKVEALLVDARGLTGVPIPSLVDRFLMAEEWAIRAAGMVIVALVINDEYIHAERFGVKVALDFGLTLDVFTSEKIAEQWLAAAVSPA